MKANGGVQISPKGLSYIYLYTYISTYMYTIYIVIVSYHAVTVIGKRPIRNSLFCRLFALQQLSSRGFGRPAFARTGKLKAHKNMGCPGSWHGSWHHHTVPKSRDFFGKRSRVHPFFGCQKKVGSIEHPQEIDL